MLLFIILSTMPLQSRANNSSETCEQNKDLLQKFTVVTWKNTTNYRFVETEVIAFETDGGRYSTSLTVAVLDEGCDWITIYVEGEGGNATAPGTTDDFYHINGHGRYYLFPEQMPWKKGAEACQQLGATLWVPKSMEELKEVYNWTGDGLWVGIHRNTTDDPWATVEGEKCGAFIYR
ncbi:uncharacterized protein [Anabrus simplex]|uniref:uncharacterized protein n=1 Tax=Anabrus simplex TaxID=316456 RepID=UPI0035A2CDC5